MNLLKNSYAAYIVCVKNFDILISNFSHLVFQLLLELFVVTTVNSFELFIDMAGIIFEQSPVLKFKNCLKFFKTAKKFYFDRCTTNASKINYSFSKTGVRDCISDNYASVVCESPYSYFYFINNAKSKNNS